MSHDCTRDGHRTTGPMPVSPEFRVGFLEVCLECRARGFATQVRFGGASEEEAMEIAKERARHNMTINALAIHGVTA